MILKLVLCLNISFNIVYDNHLYPFLILINFLLNYYINEIKLNYKIIYSNKHQQNLDDNQFILTLIKHYH